MHPSNFFVMLVVFALMVMWALYVAMCNGKPVIAKKCRDCKRKDRNWKVVPIGHDDFAWQHNCPPKPKHPLKLCFDHRQESNHSHYAEHNCDYCKALKKIKGEAE